MHRPETDNKLKRIVASVVVAVATTTQGCSSGPAHDNAPSASSATATVAAKDSLAIPPSASAVTGGTVQFAAPAKPTISTPITVTSSTFQPGATLPATMEFDGCGGRNRSPQLTWSNFPAGTKSFVITLFDPDAPTSTGFWHWVVVDVPGSVTSLPAGAGSSASPVPRAKSAYTDFAFSHYGGPCPPNGDPPHRYIFTVYALDIPAIEGVGPRSTAATVMFALRGHLLAEGSIQGKFGR